MKKQDKFSLFTLMMDDATGRIAWWKGMRETKKVEM